MDIFEKRLVIKQINHTKTDRAPLTRAVAVPVIDHHWDYNDSNDYQARDCFITCILSDLRGAALKSITFQKVQEVIQEKSEKKTFFVPLMPHKALLQHTNLDLETLDGKQLCMTYSFAQPYPDIRGKLK